MICEYCHQNKPLQRHHRLPQNKANKKAYGKIIDADFNIAMACADCNSSHQNVVLWNEKEFRHNAELNGYKLPVGTKSFQNKMIREDIK